MADNQAQQPLLVYDAYPTTRAELERRERYRLRVRPLTWLWCCVCLFCCIVVFFILGLVARQSAIGACCDTTTAECSESYERQCDVETATFQGSGTRCASITCPTAAPTVAPSPQPTFAPSPPTPAPTAEPRGSCCLLARGPSCIEATTAERCTASGSPNIFTPDAVCADTCQGFVNDTGVCCSFTVDGIVSCTSSFTTQQCILALGAVTPDSMCAQVAPNEFDCVDLPTPAPTARPTVAPTPTPTFVDPVRGSCCAVPGEATPDGVPVTCLDGVLDSECTFLGATVYDSTTFSASTACSDAGFCPGAPATSGCCQLSSGCTQSLNSSVCEEEFRGEISVPGECLATIGVCRALPTPAPTPAPTLVDPTPSPTSSPTSSPTIPQPPPPAVGGCCIDLNVGPCVPLISQSQCNAQGGTYLGDDSTCTVPGVCGNPPAPTPSPTPFPVGACCNEANMPPTCSDGIQGRVCVDTGPAFVFGGDMSTCENNPGFCGNPARICCCICDPFGTPYSQCVAETFRGCAVDCFNANAECNGEPRSLADTSCTPGVCDTPAPTPAPTPKPAPTSAPPTPAPTPAPTEVFECGEDTSQRSDCEGECEARGMRAQSNLDQCQSDTCASQGFISLPGADVCSAVGDPSCDCCCSQCPTDDFSSCQAECENQFPGQVVSAHCVADTVESPQCSRSFEIGVGDDFCGVDAQSGDFGWQGSSSCECCCVVPSLCPNSDTCQLLCDSGDSCAFIGQSCADSSQCQGRCDCTSPGCEPLDAFECTQQGQGCACVPSALQSIRREELLLEGGDHIDLAESTLARAAERYASAIANQCAPECDALSLCHASGTCRFYGPLRVVDGRVQYMHNESASVGQVACSSDADCGCASTTSNSVCR